MFGMLLLWGCGATGGETIDIVEGRYLGHPSEGKPDDGVRTPDADTTFGILFREHDRELWADVELNGAMVLHGITVEDEEDTIEGVTVDGNELSSALKVEGIVFAVDGRFKDNRASLSIDVQHVGQMTLFLVADEEPDAADTASDTGAE